MSFRLRLFRAPPSLTLKPKKVEDTKGEEVEVMDRPKLLEMLRGIDYDITTREREQRYARITERFCRNG